MSHRVILMTQRYWGKGETVADALKTLREDTGFGDKELTPDELIGAACLDWDSADLPEGVTSKDVDEKFYVAQDSSIVRPTYDGVRYSKMNPEVMQMPEHDDNVNGFL